MFTKMFNTIFSFFVFFTLFLITEGQPDSSHRIVETKNGLIRGVRLKTLLKNLDYFAFRGVPYGKAPIGELRFKVNKIVLIRSKELTK